jgi:hypothetical protein
MITTTVENVANLSEQLERAAFEFTDRTFADLDQAERALREAFPDLYVYRGGNHLALHQAAGDARRVLIVRERAALNLEALDLAEVVGAVQRAGLLDSLEHFTRAEFHEVNRYGDHVYTVTYHDDSSPTGLASTSVFVKLDQLGLPIGDY